MTISASLGAHGDLINGRDVAGQHPSSSCTASGVRSVSETFSILLSLPDRILSADYVLVGVGRAALGEKTFS